MYQNAFEALKAPTNYNTKDISRHIQLLLAEGATRDITEPHRLTLLSAVTRLYDELMTFRGADYDEQVGKLQRDKLDQLTHKLTGSSLSLFAPEAAFEWLNKMQEIQKASDKNTKSVIKKAIVNSQDIWLIQGAAALCTRIAIESETKDEMRAVSAWQEAMGWWQNFFSVASVEETYTYAMQTDERSRQECITGWQNFRNHLIRDLYTRCTVDYIEQNNGSAVNICLNVLKSADMRMLDPQIYEKAVKCIEPSIAAGLMKSTSLKEALSLWEGLPEFFRNKESILAKMFSAMVTETSNLEKGYGDLEAIESAWQKVGGDLLREKDNVEIRAAMKKYYQAVSRMAINMVSDEEKSAKIENQELIKTLMKHLPGDYMVATDPNGKEITASMFYRIFSFRDIDKALTQISDQRVYKKENARKDGKDLWEKIKKETEGEEELRQTFVTTVLVKLRERQDVQFMKDFMEGFPQNQKIKGNLETVGAAIRDEEFGSYLEKISNLLNQFASSKVDSYITMEILDDLQSLTQTAMDIHPEQSVRDALQELMKQKLIESANFYMTQHDKVAKLLALEIIGYLPHGTQIKSGDGQIPIEMVQRILTEEPSYPIYSADNACENKSVGWRKVVFFVLFEIIAIVPYMLLRGFGKIQRINLVLFIVTTVIAYVVLAIATMTRDRRDPKFIPLEYKHPVLTFVVMMVFPIVFYLQS